MSSQLNAPSSSLAGRPPEAGSVLPREYGVTLLAMLPRDPGWLHAYWEVAPYTWREVERLFGAGVGSSGRPVLRFYAGENGARSEFDVEVGLEARNWYVQAPSRPGRRRAELGLVLPDGRFALLAVSNEIWVPSGRVSEATDGNWRTLRSEWETLHELSGGGRTGMGSLDVLRGPAHLLGGSSFQGNVMAKPVEPKEEARP